MKAEHELTESLSFGEASPTATPTEGWAWAWAARAYHYRRGHMALCTPKKARQWFPTRALQPGDPRKCAKCEGKLAGEKKERANA